MPVQLCQAGEQLAETGDSMMVVGHGLDTDSGLEYAVVQNKWGADWGDHGLIRIELADPAFSSADVEDNCGLYA